MGAWAGIETAVRLTREHGLRRLPIVTEDGQVTGIVTADDPTVLLTDELSQVGDAIRDKGWQTGFSKGPVEGVADVHAPGDGKDGPAGPRTPAPFVS